MHGIKQLLITAAGVLVYVLAAMVVIFAACALLWTLGFTSFKPFWVD